MYDSIKKAAIGKYEWDVLDTIQNKLEWKY